jgi:hypothetical protein
MRNTVGFRPPACGGRLFLIALVISLMFASPTSARFQRMVLLPGSHTFSGKGGRLPAFCMDVERKTPNRFDTFGHIEGSTTFQRIDRNGKPFGEPLSYQQAQQILGARITGSGDGGIASVQIEFSKLPPDESVRALIGELSVATENATDGRQANEVLKPFQKGLKYYAEREQRLKEALGEQSGLIQKLHNQTPGLLWELRTTRPIDLSDPVHQTLEESLLSFTGETDQRTLEALTVLHGSELTAEQTLVVRRVLRPKLPSKPEYAKEFKDDLGAFQKARRLLEDVFGIERGIGQFFAEHVAEEVSSGRRLSEAIKTAGRELIRPEVRKHPSLAKDFLALTQEVRLSPDQAREFGKLIDLDLTPGERRLDDHLVIVPLPGEGVRFNSLNSSKSFGGGELNAARLREVIGTSKRIFVRGVIGEQLAKQLNEAGVYFVRDERQLFLEPTSRPVKKIRLVMVAAKGNNAESQAANRQIYGLDKGASVQSIEKAIELAERAEARFVRDRKTLEEALNQARLADELPIVFFHNDFRDAETFAQGKILFADGTSMEVKDFTKDFGKFGALPIACNTFGTPKLGVRSTTELFVIDFVKAFKTTAERLQKEPKDLDELLNTLGAEYAKSQGRRHAVIVAVGAGGPSFLLFVLQALLSDDEDEDEEKKKDEKKDSKEQEKKDPEGQADRDKPSDRSSLGNPTRIDSPIFATRPPI